MTTGKDSPTITTQASETASGMCGSSLLSDSATLAGGYNETGTITFTLTAPNGTTTTVGTVTVSGNGTYSSPTVTATQVGTYVFHANYSGDALNNAALDNGKNESLTTGKDSPTITTQASETASGMCGSSLLSDTATLAGGYDETGTITFTLTAPNGTTTTVGTVTVSGNGTYSSPTVTATQVGTYVFHANYSGDSLNNAALDNGKNESLRTGKDSPTIATQASETASGVCNTSVLTDAATLAGGYNETGTITFTLTAPNGTTTTVGTVTVSGNGTYTSPTVTATQVGTYVFHATYSGDSLNNSAVDNGTNESLTIVAADRLDQRHCLHRFDGQRPDARRYGVVPVSRSISTWATSAITSPAIRPRPWAPTATIPSPVWRPAPTSSRGRADQLRPHGSGPHRRLRRSP